MTPLFWPKYLSFHLSLVPPFAVSKQLKEIRLLWFVPLLPVSRLYYAFIGSPALTYAFITPPESRT